MPSLFMTLQIYQYMTEDVYAPETLKPSLQQYDNYQIYDLYCEDITFQVASSVDGNYANLIKNKNRLAVQAYSIQPIPCNFDAIIKQYL